MFELFAKSGFPWEQVHIFWVDERCVPPSDPQSNFRMANETWLVPAKVPAGNIHRVPTELEPHEAARKYAEDLRAFLPSDWVNAAFDVVHRGMGPDAHTASLFPGEPLIADHEGIAAAVWVEKMHQWRVTLLPGVLEAARNTVVFATGADKAEALEAVLQGPYDPMKWPAQIGARGGNMVPDVHLVQGSAEGNGMRTVWLLPLLVRSSQSSPISRTAEQPAPEPARTHLVLGGDVMLSRHVARVAREKNDPAFPLRDLAPVLQAADIAFVNLESPFSDRGAVVEHGMIFKAEPEMIAALELAGVDVVSTANNHARDQGSHGVEFTLDWLERHHIAVAGTGISAEAAHAGVVIERNGVKFGFLAYTFDQSNGNHTDTDDRVAVMDVAQMREDVGKLAARADAIIVSMHAGIEYSPKSNAQQVAFAQAAIDAGASVVVGIIRTSPSPGSGTARA